METVERGGGVVQETTVFSYRFSMSRKEWAKASLARKAAGELWTRLVKIHHFCRVRHWPWPTEAQLKAHFKQCFPLHSQTVQAIIEKFCANIDSTRTKRQQGDKTTRYPHRYRRYFNPVFKGQALRIGEHILALPLGKGREPINVHIPRLPQGRIVQAELGFNTLYLTVTKEIPEPKVPVVPKAAGLDLGIIQLGVVSDAREALAISGRGLRAVKQGRAKAQAQIRRKLSRCKKGSRRWKKLRRAMHRRSQTAERVTRNALHHTANAIASFCQAQEVTTLFTGDLANINRNKRKQRTRRINQEIGVMEFGRLLCYLGYKLGRYGITLTKGSEAYTSQTCPHCGHLNKVAGRTYRCRSCGYKAHRDAVGSVNILSKGVHGGEIRPGVFLVPKRIKYRRPVPLKGTSRRSCG